MNARHLLIKETQLVLPVEKFYISLTTTKPLNFLFLIGYVTAEVFNTKWTMQKSGYNYTDMWLLLQKREKR